MLKLIHKILVFIFMGGYFYFFKEMWKANDWFGILFLSIIIMTFVCCSIFKFKEEYNEKQS